MPNRSLSLQQPTSTYWVPTDQPLAVLMRAPEMHRSVLQPRLSLQQPPSASRLPTEPALAGLMQDPEKDRMTQ